jgi:hypothetical protein
MKTERSKQLIEQALRAMPQDFSLRDARYHIGRALAEIHKVEKKKAKRQSEITPRQQWEFDLHSGKLVPPGMNNDQKIDYVKKIDELISAEQSKIDSIDKPQSKDLLTD